MARTLMVASAAALTLALAACTTLPPPPPADPGPPLAGPCNAQGARWAIGQAATPEVVERVRVDTGSRVARVIPPGAVVTMDFSAERVNVHVNDRDAVTGITCG